MNSRCAIGTWLECFPEKPSWCWNEQVCQGRKRVKRFERSNGLNRPRPLLHYIKILNRQKTASFLAMFEVIGLLFIIIAML